jgi:hypothetical protein
VNPFCRKHVQKQVQISERMLLDTRDAIVEKLRIRLVKRKDLRLLSDAKTQIEAEKQNAIQRYTCTGS